MLEKLKKESGKVGEHTVTAPKGLKQQVPGGD